MYVTIALNHSSGSICLGITFHELPCVAQAREETEKEAGYKKATFYPSERSFSEES
jgi:hypothetical protein